MCLRIIIRSPHNIYQTQNSFREYSGFVGGDLIHDFRGPTKDYILSELERRKDELRTKLVWIGAQKEPGFTSRIWKWVNGNVKCIFLISKQGDHRRRDSNDT